MKAKIVLVLLVLLTSGIACRARINEAAPANANRSEPPQVVALNSPDAFTKALEQRWTKENVVRFASPGRRFWNGCQNLVSVPHCEKNGAVWEQDMFKGADIGFDRVWWYATVCDNNIELYSVNARRGSDHWLVELGDLAKLSSEPDVEPTYKNPCYADGPHPAK